MIYQSKHLLQAWYYRAATLQEKAHPLDTLKLPEKCKHAVKWVHRHSYMICLISKIQKLAIYKLGQILNYSPAELEIGIDATSRTFKHA